MVKLGRRTYETSQMEKLYDRNRVALWRMAKGGQIPAPIKFGNRNYWDAEVVDNHLNELFAEVG